MKKIRVTGKYLSKWINDKFKELEIGLVVLDIRRTYYRPEDYEAGAAFLNIRVAPPGDVNNWLDFNCFYPMRELSEYINSGEYRLQLKTEIRFGYGFELEVAKL